MKIIAIVLLCVAIGFGVLLFRQSATNASQESQLNTIEAELSALKRQSKLVSLSLDLQIKCSEQAKKAFVQSGLKANDLAAFQSHYNATLKKCFIDTSNTSVYGKTTWNYRNIYDAIEGKEYGIYIWHTDPIKKYWEVPPIKCEVESLQGEQQYCNSEKEFSKLVNIYMAE